MVDNSYKKLKKNYAFIDGQNLYMGMKALSWKLDYKRFKIYLKEKYFITSVFIFLGYIEKYKHLYEKFEKLGYTLIFRKVSLNKTKKIKGNVDISMTVYILTNLDKFDKAVLITSDGDFYPLVDELISRDKLEVIISPHRKLCSHLLKSSSKGKIGYLDELQDRLKQD